MSGDRHQNLLSHIRTFASEVPLDLVRSVAEAIEKMTLSDWRYARDQIVASMPQPKLREQVSHLLDTWRNECRKLPPASIALALKAASQTAEEYRDSESTSLIWTGPTSQHIPLRRTDGALLQVINTARSRLLIVSFAVYKIQPVQKALVQAAGRGVDIRICVEAPEPSEGKITFDTIGALGEHVAQRATVYIWPLAQRPRDLSGRHGSLHVKCAVADDNLLFLSSANLTEYAFTLNMELGVLIRGGKLPADVVGHFDRLIADDVLLPVR